MDTSNNDITVKSYSACVKEYIRNTPSKYNSYHRHMLRWVHNALDLLSDDAKIFEIGSAVPRDAQYMRGLGHSVQCSDASPEMVKRMQSVHESAIVFNALKDEVPTGYSMFFANSVLPHFSDNQTEDLFNRIYAALAPGGVFAFNFKEGEGEEWVHEKITQPRYVIYSSPEKVTALVEKTGFELKFLEHKIPGDLPNHDWINVIAQKPTN